MFRTLRTAFDVPMDPVRYRLTLACDVRLDGIEDDAVRGYVRAFGGTPEERHAARASAERQRALLDRLRELPDQLEEFLSHVLAAPAADEIDTALASRLGAEGLLYYALRRALDGLDMDSQKAFAVAEADGMLYEELELVRQAVHPTLTRATLRRVGDTPPPSPPADGATPALLPCPFCGSDRVRLHGPEVMREGDLGDVDVEAGFVGCEACGTCGPAGTDPELVVTRWNSRVDDQASNSA